MYLNIVLCKACLLYTSRGQPVVLAGDKPAGFIKDGLHGKLVMLEKQVLFGGSVVGIFRVDMLECCLLYTSTSRWTTCTTQRTPPIPGFMTV